MDPDIRDIHGSPDGSLILLVSGSAKKFADADMNSDIKISIRIRIWMYLHSDSDSDFAIPKQGIFLSTSLEVKN